MHMTKQNEGWIFGVFARLGETYHRPVWVMRGLAVLLFAAKPLFAGVLYLIAYAAIRWLASRSHVAKRL